MKKITTTALVLALSAGSLAAAPAYAKGGDGGEARAKLKAELAQSRAKSGTSGTSLFDRLFGGDADRAEKGSSNTSN